MMLSTRMFMARLTVAIVIFVVAQCAAQDAQSVKWVPYDLPLLQQTTLKSAEGAAYRIILATPAGPAPAKGYPVIYVVDGNAYTALVSEMIRYNMDVGVQSRVEPAVVVGIGYPTGQAYDLTRRTLDFTTKASANKPGISVSEDPTGGDVAFMNFIDGVVKPVIEARFKIDRNRQTLLGHSLGGLFTLLTMINRPQSFQTYAALSPSIWWNSDALLSETKQFIERKDRPQNVRVFLSVGDLEQFMTRAFIARSHAMLRSSFKTQAEADAEADKEIREMKAKTMVENARRMSSLLKAGHIETVFVEFPGDDHFSVVPEALGRAVPFALDDRSFAQ